MSASPVTGHEIRTPGSSYTLPEQFLNAKAEERKLRAEIEELRGGG